MKHKQEKPHHYPITTKKMKTENISFGALKTGIFLLLILIQMVLLVLSYLTIFAGFKSFLTISLIISVATCIYILSSNKNSHSKAVWILFIMINYSFGYLFYFASHEKFLFRNFKKRYNKIYESTKKFNSPQLITNNQINNLLYQTENLNTYSNNIFKYHNNGKDYFDAMLEKIKHAKKYIFLEFYIIANGKLWKRFVKLLEQKVKEGVEVRVIYDSFGSHKYLPRKQKKQIRALGIKLKSFNKFIPKFSIILNFRNHRKIAIIDGETIFTGGANIGDEYVNAKNPYGYWKDCGVEIEGPATKEFLLMFLRQWSFVTKSEEDYSKYISTANLTPGNTQITPYAEGITQNSDVVKNIFSSIISNAKEKIYISTPYFIPDNTLFDQLKTKALQGVDVRILLPDIPDKKMVYIVSINNAEKLMQYGVKVYCLKNSFVHSKIVANENEFTVGTANFDLRSFYQQFECGIYSDNEQATKDIINDFENCFENSTIITKEKMKRNRLPFRIAAGLLQIISPFM